MSGSRELIAGWKSAEDWRTLRAMLVIGGSPDLWQQAFREYFQTRLELRYFHPIRVLRDHGTFRGEGFSILAIHCTLIEFLESTIQGVKYRHLRRGEKLAPYEYSSGRDVFVSFLVKRQPFAEDFDQKLALDFYVGVRCGLLHEARTKSGWRVRARGTTEAVIDADDRIVYRDNFHDALQRFIASYGAALVNDPKLQQAFIRKFEDLCE
jgi:hypothetical protein